MFRSNVFINTWINLSKTYRLNVLQFYSILYSTTKKSPKNLNLKNNVPKIRGTKNKEKKALDKFKRQLLKKTQKTKTEKER